MLYYSYFWMQRKENNQDLPFISYNTANRDFARYNRNNPTKAESLMRNCVLKWDKTWYRFNRQKSLWWFIVDFYCSKLLLAIEIDWWYHNEVQDYDEVRSNILENKYWIKIVRFTNEDVENNLDWVLLEMEEIVKNRSKELNL